MKGEIRPIPAHLNKFRVEVAGLPPFYCKRIGPFRTELETADAPDRTRHLAGESSIVEFEFEAPLHHVEEHAALGAWFLQCQAGAPGAKRAGTIHYLSAVGIPISSQVAIGWILTARELPELDRESTDIAFVTYACSADAVTGI